MKEIYLIIALFTISPINAQEAELFENTWYLRTVQSDDLASIFDVAEVDPPIAPYLIISEDLSFNGEGACNAFNGTYNFFPPNNMNATDFVATTDDCGVEGLNRFEDAYFWFISLEFWYDISHDGEGDVLTMGTPMGGVAVFKSYALSSENFYKNEFTLYPNPVNDILIIKKLSETGHLTVKILNIQGKLLITQNFPIENQISIDVSNIPFGIYILNFEDEKGNEIIKKFIKK